MTGKTRFPGHRRAAWVGLALWLWLWVGVASADTYTQHTEATIDDIASQTVATTPADRTRTTIGIAEQVTCSVDPSSWSDKDCNTTPDPNVIENDTMGTVTWSVAGAGSVSPTTGNSTTLSAHKSAGTATVQAEVKDSQTKYSDLVTKTKAFSVIAPNDESVARIADVGYPPAGNNRIGQRTTWRVTVLPTSVSFYNAEFRENIPAHSFTWPDGHVENIPLQQLPYSVQQDNTVTDTFGDGPFPKAWLWNAGEAKYEDHSDSFQYAVEYKNQSTLWVPYKQITTTTTFRAADFKCRTNFGGTQGNWQGPWQ
jgi:hypothetical protein